MASNPGIVAPSGTGTITMLERLSQGRVLILLLSFCFYADLWLLTFNIDPRRLALGNGLSAVKNVPILTIAIFILSYSLLMGVLFPVARRLVGILRIAIQSNLTLVKIDQEERLLADWSLAVVVLAATDALVGRSAPAHAYKGLALFVCNVLAPDSFVVNVARVCIALCCLACLMLAITVDG